MDDQFVVPERRGTPDDPITYPGSWRGLTPSPPAQTGVTKDPSMGTAVIVPPTPLSKEVQIEDDRGDGQHVVVSIDETRPPADHVPTPVQHDEDGPEQRPDVEVPTHIDRLVRKKVPNTRYPSKTYDLHSARMQSRKSIRRAK